MNEEVDPLSSNALTSTDDPSAAKTSTLQVRRRELDLSFMAALETTCAGDEESSAFDTRGVKSPPP